MGSSMNVLADAPAHRSPSTRFYRPELDGLKILRICRCVCVPYAAARRRVLSCAASAGTLAAWLAVVRAGMSGVDLFFALSAFLITSLLLKERRETGRVSLRLSDLMYLADLAIVFSSGCLGRRAGTCGTQPAAAPLALGCRVPTVCQQLDVPFLRTGAINLRSIMDGID